jgi:VWFA-related protein
MSSQVFLPILFLFALILPSVAQVQQRSLPSNTAQSTPTPNEKDDVVRITTNLVQVDVVVTKNGKVVNDLNANDFEIFEDGKRQSITNFLYVSNVSNTAPVASMAPTDKKAVPFPPAPIKANEPRRIMALVVDDLGLSAESIAQVRKQLRAFVDEQVQPNDLVAIIRTGADIGALQQFTNDKRLLLSAVKQVQWNICSRVGTSVFSPAQQSTVRLIGGGGGSPCGWESIRSSLSALRFVLRAMGELPGRKSMVLFSDSIPRQEQEVPLPAEDEDLQADERSYYGLLQRLAEIAIRNSIVIYGVDTQGLQPALPTAADMITSDNLKGPITSSMINQQLNALHRNRMTQLIRRREGADILSSETGGFLVKNSNDFRLDRIMEDQQGYYLLGYRPSAETFNRRFHHITARVKKSGLTLRTRKGFYGFTEEEANRFRATEGSKTDLALISPFRAHDIAIELTTVFASDPAAGSILRSFLYLNAKDLTFVDEGEGWYKVAVEMRGIIFGNNGRPLDQIVVTPTVRLRQKGYEQALQDGLVLRFDMPVKRPGPYQLRVAARDLASSRVGSAGQFVTVPDLTKKELALSGIVLSGQMTNKILTISAPLSANATVTGAGEPQVTTNPVNRRYAAGTDLTFACVLYNAELDASRQPRSTVQAKLFREGRQVLSTDPMPVDASLQKDLTRIAVLGVVRLKPDLEPGRYFLQLLASDSPTKDNHREALQWIDFEVLKP